MKPDNSDKARNNEKTNSEFLSNARRVGESHPFLAACALVPMEPSVREVGRWRKGQGRALKAAWKKWPNSKNLPKLRG